MILSIRVIPKASRNLVKKEGGHLKAYLTKPACNGQANAQLVSLLSDYLHTKKYHINIIKGHKARDKIVEINA